MSLTALILSIVAGLALASVYVLIAISFTLVLAASGVFNFVQGSVVMLGTIVTFVLGVSMGWPALATVAAVAATGIAAGLLTHVIAVWPVMGRTADFTHATMLTTIGLGTIVNAVVALLFGTDAHRVPSYVTETPLNLFSVPLRPTYLVMIAAGLLVTLSTELVVRRTAVGHMFRATLEDAEYAQLQGIDTRRVIAFAFGCAGLMSAVAGYLIAPVISASSHTAQELAFYGFAGMAIGGFGSFAGALIGGVIVGLIAGITPTLAGPTLALPLIWIVMLAVLLFRPSGLCGTAGLFGSAGVRDV